MGIFDIFTNKNAQDAANAQRAAIQQGYGQLSDLYGQGRDTLTGNVNTGLGDLSQQYGAAQNALTQQFGTGRQDITQAYGAGRGDLATNYAAGLSPYLQNYQTSNQGQQMLSNALGLGGQSGRDAATAAFQAGPGYQWQLDQGNENILRNQGRTGQLNSGATNIDLLNYGQGQANQQWQNWINTLSPYVNAANTSAGGIGSLYSGLGNALNANQMGQGNALNANSMGLGTSLAGNMQGLGTQQNQTYSNMGSQLLGSMTGQGTAAYGADTSMGNAQANADLANNAASANLWNMGGKLLGLGGNLVGSQQTGNTGSSPGAGGGINWSGIGTGIGNAASGMGSGLMSLFGSFSDARLKDDIEPVGELYDGKTVYRYRFKGSPRHQIGLIAQEVEQSEPEAVGDSGVGGLKMVDYWRATNRAADLMRLAA